ncbi:uncharacterized protein [Populus alba]|uniref:DUF4220 domain-containing protein n=1 Tax=Populus alba TaxID=43335 RepID=A0A4U5PP66_POPAL|nr:hypothetical protein D5086_0000201710 [Populus alba]
MLLGLLLQIILTILGERRKYTVGLGDFLWLAYLSADSVAMFSLGILVRSVANSTNPNLIPVFWAPILLVHIGGPGTISAYSMHELDKLLINHLLQLVTRVGVVGYVLFRLRENAFMLVAIPIFISGMIKYGERIWVLKRNKESSNLAQQPSAKRSCIHIEDIISITKSSREVRYLNESRLLFNTSKMLFQNLDLVNFDQKITYDLVSGKKAEEAFQLTEIEMGLKYDRLYSKVATVSWPRFILRSVTFLSSIFALVSFSVMIKSNLYSKNDRIISYVLLSGVVCLESYSIIERLFSDWTRIWLYPKAFHNLHRNHWLSLLLSSSRKRKRWSRLMGQHNLVSALSKKPVNKLRKKYFPGNRNIHSWVDVDKDLKELIFKQVKDKRSRLRENAFMLVAIPIFISGMIKYGERIWVFKRNKESNNLSQQPSAKKATCIPLDDRFSITGSSREVRYFHEARLLFNTSKRLFQNLDLVYFDQKFTYDLVSGKKAEEAFQLTEIEMGLKYDRLYSKVATVSWPRFIIRSVTFLSSIFALVSFSIMIKSKSVYSKNDRIISYVLLSGVVCLESYSIIGHLFSDWPMIWLIRLEKTFPDLYTTRCFSLLLSFSRKRKRWSRLMGQQSQHNLVSALSKKPVNKLRKKYFPGTWNFHSREDVDKDLKELIFKQVKDKSRSRYDPDTNDDFPVLLKLLEERGCSVLQSKGCFRELGWSVTRVEFSHSLLTWHIATHVCYIDDSKKNGFANDQNCAMSRLLSNYMLYLLVQYPNMLAMELSGTRYTDTRIHLHRLLFIRNSHKEISMDKLDTLSFPEAQVKAFFYELLRSPFTMLKEIREQREEKSALLDGCMLAMSLQSLESSESLDGWPNEKKWEMISEVWVEMLMYAASHSVWKEHVHALARGGELLTHVCLLMAHLGLSKQCPPAISDDLDACDKRLDDFLKTVDSEYDV